MFKLRQPSYPSLTLFLGQYSKHCLRCFSSQPQQKSNTSEDGPWTLYTQRIADNTISKDAHQETVVHHLQQIYDKIRKYERPDPPKEPSAFFNFFKKSKPQKIVAPTGLYIFGSVGGGKTMLMDLFYETVPVSI